ncbi:MAG: hypothetical protein HC837_12365 [Chloroflexaceae bacterium]|nr:hypothetical protein [Chloroflexaceae bacterium]
MCQQALHAALKQPLKKGYAQMQRQPVVFSGCVFLSVEPEEVKKTTQPGKTG